MTAVLAVVAEQPLPGTEVWQDWRLTLCPDAVNTACVCQLQKPHGHTVPRGKFRREASHGITAEASVKPTLGDVC